MTRVGGALVCALSYTEDALEADRRLRHGDRQVWCPTCRLWRWAEECGHPDRLTERQLKALVRSAEKRWPSSGHKATA